MNLKELKSHFESMPDGTRFDYSLSDPFSWRGVYAEVAFSILNEPSTKEEILSKINDAITEVFEGYKGGDFWYSEDTTVHFEACPSDYTDGDYVLLKLLKILFNN